MSRAFDGVHELALVFGARPCYALRDDLPLFRDESLQAFFVLVVDVFFLGGAESARTLLARELVVFVPSRPSLCSFFQCVILLFQLTATASDGATPGHPMMYILHYSDRELLPTPISARPFPAISMH
jgi:hypothetical protein